jgi:hypothetical protein
VKDGVGEFEEDRPNVNDGVTVPDTEGVLVPVVVREDVGVTDGVGVDDAVSDGVGVDVGVLERVVVGVAVAD